MYNYYLLIECNIKNIKIYIFFLKTNFTYLPKCDKFQAKLQLFLIFIKEKIKFVFMVKNQIKVIF